MEHLKLSKDKLGDFVAKLGDKEVLVPQKEGEALKFAPLTGDSVPELDYANTSVPPKNAVFPQTETMLRFEWGKMETTAVTGEAKEKVFFGVRPCDARAKVIVDKLFTWDEKDPYYVEKREKSTVVGLACAEPCSNCFCTSVGGGPASTEGLDVLLTDLGESYLVQPLTDEGQSLCQAASDDLEKAAEGDVQAAEKVHQEAEKKISRQIDTGGIPEGLPGLWENELWEKVSQSCLGCGICTYLCPTCHCFDMQDEVEGFDGRRCRTWDSCMFSEYTMHASGHNPRPTRRERTRNRINHKYSYFVDKFDVIACVGCGRCISLCPVNIDILDILSKVKEAL